MTQLTVYRNSLLLSSDVSTKTQELPRLKTFMYYITNERIFATEDYRGNKTARKAKCPKVWFPRRRQNHENNISLYNVTFRIYNYLIAFSSGVLLLHCVLYIVSHNDKISVLTLDTYIFNLSYSLVWFFFFVHMCISQS